LCVGGCELLETDNHLFLDCSFFGTIWQLVHKWLGVHLADPTIIADLFFFYSLTALQVMENQ